MDLHIALLGFGTVGSRFAQYINQHQALLKLHSNSNISLDAIYTRTRDKVSHAGLDHLLVSDISEIMHNKKINCVVELMGGIDYPKDIIFQAIKEKKHIITANKALLAHHGDELLRTAKDNGVTISFEASCAGGIPIIKSLTEGLSANTQSAIYGVLNGTCNFILTEMDEKGLSFTEALNLASELGFAESDPTLDIDGFDAGHKIKILSSLAFNASCDMNNISITGITGVLNKDLHFGKKLSYSMKLIASGSIIDNKISIWVHPAFLTETHPMTSVKKSFNAISIIGDEVGHTFHYGRGAGGKPTNSAIISDVIALANESYPIIFQQIINNTQYIQALEQVSIEEFFAPVYIRVLVDDNTGTLSTITNIFAQYNISIARVLQEDVLHMPHFEDTSNGEKSYESLAELIIITHSTPYKAILAATKVIEGLEINKGTVSVYPIIDAPIDSL